MARISIIGGGAFGTALACVVRRSGHDVLLWAREPEVVESINRDRANPHFLPDVDLVPGIQATGDLARASAEAELVLTAVPAQHVRAITTSMRPSLPRGTPVVSCSKGIERGTCALMPEVLAETLPQATVAVLSGPSFASEIAKDQPCAVALACADASAAEKAARLVANPRFCVHMTDDVIGTALGGVMKNVVSIASGIAHGRKLGENARATIVTLGLAESARLGVAKGGRAETFLGLAGAGDFMLTANSLQSRNTSLGVALGEGRRLADILAGRKQVTEGAFSAEAAAELGRRLEVELPITEGLDALLNHGQDLDEAIGVLLRRHPPVYRAL
ncbi:MAG TPA: NAD(P)H-dependent glycerol-3-phosphate dehydrogenase [Usitatibacter sp.]|nr:NAD(P)H-dependent glycerol-3-phosphate dehydrogenase [Usitatibacter sp.]